MFFGSIPALVTPFSGGRVAEDTFRDFLEWQIAEGSDALVPCGTTGEVATLSIPEQRRVTELAVEVARGRVPVVAGCGSNDIATATEHLKAAKEAGADAALVVTGYYNRPSQAGLIAAFRALSDVSELPIIVYNVPGRTGSNIEAKTSLTLAEHPRIVAVKEASGNLGQIMDVIRGAPAGFQVLSGDDSLTLAVMAAGGTGIVSVVSNIAPRRMSRLAELCAKGDLAAARQEHLALMPLMSAAFIESNPIPAKAALAMMRKMESTVRLPLVPLDDKHVPILRSALQAAGVEA